MPANRARYLFSEIDKVGKLLKNKRVYLFLDYDGTLAPIVRNPKNAACPKKTRQLLEAIGKSRDYKIAIISGRTLSDVSKRAGIKNIVYVGSHGFEIKGPGIKFERPLPLRYRRTLEEIKAGLKKRLSGIRGVIIEDKKYSLCVHYRMAASKEIPRIRAAFYGVLASYKLLGNVKTRTGKTVLEVLQPLPWNKGSAVLWLLDQRPFAALGIKNKVTPVYIGDDTTDEDAFLALKNRGITIYVGRPEATKARYYVKDTRQVAVMLAMILKNIKAGGLWPKKR